MGAREGEAHVGPWITKPVDERKMDAVWQIETYTDRLGDGAGASASSTALPNDVIDRTTMYVMRATWR